MINNNNEKWLNDQCLQILGQKNKGTIQYMKSLAKKAKNLIQLEKYLQEFQIIVNNNPRNQYFAQELYHKFGNSTLKERKSINQENKKIQYSFVDMEIGKNNKIFIDKEIDTVKNAEMLRNKDIKQRNQLAQRLLQKDQMGKNKLIKHNIKGVTLTVDEKIKIMPDLKNQSRMKYLDKRQKQQLQRVKKHLEDEKTIFNDNQLSIKEIQQRKLKQTIHHFASNNAKNQVKVSNYQMPQIAEEIQNQLKLKDKKMKTLYGRYQDVPNTKPQSQLWEGQQGQRNKGKYKTIDEIELKHKKNYDLILNNSVNFIKTDLLKKIKNFSMNDSSSEQMGSSELSSSSDQSESVSHQSKQKTKKIKINHKKSAIEITKQSLPIYKYREKLLTLIRDNQIIIMVGETGSGKTTQLPQYLHELGYTKKGKIGCTQPRRVAAMSVASRVSQEIGCKLGQEVGYCIRFEDNTSQNTIIKYMTDGMLLREFMIEPDLASYSVIIIDQAHERSLHTDIVITLIKDLCLLRPQLRVVISSATLQAEKFSQYFDKAPIIKIPGRRFPVDIYYTEKPQANYIDASIVTILQIHLTQDNGDILCFMTGQDQIQETVEELNQKIKGLGSKVKQLIILPIYSGLPSDMQAKIFEKTPKNSRKVVLATNIAETSLTIDNIFFVIDCGFVKQTAYNPRTGMDSLIVVPISKASANQRAGRAGRVAPGKCFRLYTLWSYEKQLQQSTIPEIQRSNIGNVILMLKSIGIDNLVEFDFLDAPPHDMLVRGLQMLYALGALNDIGQLTKLGRKMAQFPLDPMLSKMLIKSQQYHCIDQISTICAMLSVGNSIFFRPKQRKMHADNAKKSFFRPGGDHITLLNVFNTWKQYNQSVQWCNESFIQSKTLRKANDIKQQLILLLERVEIDINNEQLSIYSDDLNTNILKCIVSGFFINCALKYKDHYKTIKFRMKVQIHPSSMLYKDEPQCLIYNELVLTTQEYMRHVIEVQPCWLIQIAPHIYKAEDFMGLDQQRKKLKKETQY